MIFFFIVFVIIAYRICSLKNGSYKLFNLWLAIFSTYFIFTLISHSYIEDPYRDYFISVDQLLFYSNAISLSNLSYGSIFEHCFNTFKYSDTPLSIAIFASIAKIGKSIGVTDILLLEKFNIVFLGSLISIYIYKIVLLKTKDYAGLRKQIFMFAFLSPILILSAQMLRDIHVCFVYTLLLYYSLKDKCRLRWLYLIGLILIAYFLRRENGLFAILFLIIPLWNVYNKSNIYAKILLLFTLVIILVLNIGFVVGINEVMNDTISSYTERSISHADSGSLGVKLNNFPFPVNYILKATFAQFLPFPIWLPFTNDAPYVYIRIVECFFPFYWIAILWSIIKYIKLVYKRFDKILFVVFVIAVLYLVLCSASEFGTRRLLAVFPVLFSIFLIIYKPLNISVRKSLNFSIPLIIFLHLVYLFIK